MGLPFGQGAPLPANFGHDGQWLTEGLLFLYRLDGAQPVGGATARFTAYGPGADGKLSLGFDAGQIASAFGVELECVFDANRDGKLQISVGDTRATGGGSHARRYVFRLGDKTTSVVMQSLGEAGHA